jgi:DNA repair protein RecN (Recombination protein N)
MSSELTLSISNFALIDHLELDFSPGFNALTGETGAGKSIIVDAMSTLLGGRADSDLIRTGSDQALIDGVFTLSGEVQQEYLFPLLEEYGVKIEGDLILSRELNRQGRNICRINGRIVTLRLLREVGQRLIDIHNQGEHLSLLRVREHLELLDRFGGLTDLRERVEAKVKALYRVRRELERLLADERELARRIDLLQYQVREIKAAKLEPGEEEELEREHTLLANAEQLITQINAAYEALYEGREDQEAALDLLGEARRILASLEEIDPQLQERRKSIEEASAQLGELAQALRSYRDAIDYSPQRLAQVEERLGLISSREARIRLDHPAQMLLDPVDRVLVVGEDEHLALPALVLLVAGLPARLLEGPVQLPVGPRHQRVATPLAGPVLGSGGLKATIRALWH